MQCARIIWNHPRSMEKLSSTKLVRVHFDIWQNWYNYVKFKNKIKFKKKLKKKKGWGLQQEILLCFGLVVWLVTWSFKFQKALTGPCFSFLYEFTCFWVQIFLFLSSTKITTFFQEAFNFYCFLSHDFSHSFYCFLHRNTQTML